MGTLALLKGGVIKRIFAGATMAALVAGSQLSFAQGKPMLRVVVEGVGQEAEACGIQAAAIESTAVRALNKHGIQVSSNSEDPYLYLNVTAYRVMQASRVVGCTTRLGVSVRGHAGAEPLIRGFKSRTGAYVVLCDGGRLLSGSRRDVAAAITKAFEEDIKTCLGELDY
jgi:hypothetical protein